MAFPWSVFRVWFSVFHSVPSNLLALPFLFRLFFHNSWFPEQWQQKEWKKTHAGIYFKGTKQNAFCKSLQVMPTMQIMSKKCMMRHVWLLQIKTRYTVDKWQTAHLNSESFHALYTLKLYFTWTKIEVILCLNIFQLSNLMLSEGSWFSELSDDGLSLIF